MSDRWRAWYGSAGGQLALGVRDSYGRGRERALVPVLGAGQGSVVARVGIATPLLQILGVASGWWVRLLLPYNIVNFNLQL